MGGLFIIGIATHVADMGIGEGDDLAAVREVGEDLLITGHGGIEYHLSDRLTVISDGFAGKPGPVFQNQQGGFAHVTSV